MYIRYELVNSSYNRAIVVECNAIAYEGAFGNCQNFVINTFRDLISENARNNNYLNNYLYKISHEWGRMYCVIDITEYTYEKLKSLVNDGKLNVTFVVESPYQNYNDSDMVLCILDLSELKLIE